MTQKKSEKTFTKNSISSLPEISVIVCHHRGDFLDTFIPSVRASLAATYEIIIITSDENLKAPGCLIYVSQAMPAEKRNIGARLAKAPILGFFDDDVEIDKYCLLQFVEFLVRTKDAGMVYGKLHNAERQDRFDEAGGFLTSTGFIWSRAGQNDIDTGQFDKCERILAGKSASCAIRKDVFDKVGGFDEGFGILGEETDLSWRVWLAGYGVWFDPFAKGIHYFNTMWKPANEYYTSKRVHFNGCKNYLAMLIKNLGREHLWIVPVHATIWFFAGIVMVITFKARQGANILKALLYTMVRLPILFTSRRVIQERRKINESDLWPQIYRKAPRGYYSQRFFRYLRIGLHG